MPRGTPHILMTLLIATLAACSGLRQVDPAFTGLDPDLKPAEFTCCHEPERFPAPVAYAMLALAPTIGPKQTRPEDRPGYLAGNAEAEAHLLSVLRPLDVVLSASKQRVTGRILPGWFTHSAVYLGTEAQLRAAGLWSDPAFAPMRDAVRSGDRFIEAYIPEVAMTPPGPMFQADAIAVIRPELDRASRVKAMRVLMSRVGDPFDLTYDIRNCGAVTCTELIYNAMPDLDWTTRMVYDRKLILPDDIAAQAVRGERMKLVDYVRGTEQGWSSSGTRGVMHDITAYWGPAPEK